MVTIDCDGLSFDGAITSVESPNKAGIRDRSTITATAEVRNCSGFTQQVRLTAADLGTVAQTTVPTGEAQTLTGSATVTGSYAGYVRLESKFPNREWYQRDSVFTNIVAEDKTDAREENLQDDLDGDGEVPAPVDDSGDGPVGGSDDQPDTQPTPPSLSIKCGFGGADITAGQTVTIPATVTAGDGQGDATGTVTFEVAGASATEQVRLAPGTSTTVSRTFEITEPGEYTPTVTVE